MICVCLLSDDCEENVVKLQTDSPRQLAAAQAAVHRRPAARPDRPVGVPVLLRLTSGKANSPPDIVHQDTHFTEC